jgi:hypothetical protein
LALMPFFPSLLLTAFLSLLQLLLPRHSFNMVHFVPTLGLALSVASVFVSANPIPTPAPDFKNAVALQKRASCTFTAASAASKSKKDCATIVLDNIAVPSGTTLDLTDLESGTHVRLYISQVYFLLILIR